MIHHFEITLRGVAQAALLSALAGTGAASPVIQYDFADASRVEAFRAAAGKSCEIEPATQPLHAGRKAITIRPTLTGAQRAGVPLPKDFTKGVVSFWFYDSVFSSGPTGSKGSTGWSMGGSRIKDGKSVGVEFGVGDGRGEAEWTIFTGGLRLLSGIKRHEGWTKFDIVMDPAGADPAAAVYIDGSPAYRLPVAGFKPGSFAFQTYWGANDMTVADLVVDDDVTAFHPAAVQTITAGDEANNAALAPGQALQLTLGLDPKGARAPRGVVEVELLDLQEKSAAKVKSEIVWSAVQGAKIAVSVPALPASKHYWVIASYFDEGKPEAASRTIGKVNVQYLAAAKTQDFRGRLVLAQSWDWQPATRSEPVALPATWDGAVKMKNLWYSNADRRQKDAVAGWYRRSIEIPASWSGRRLLLRIEQPHNAATVFVNGKLAGEVIWPGGDIDLTGKVKPNTKAELVIRVDALAETELTRAVTAAMGKGAELPEQFRSEARGLGGEVALVCQPTGATIDGVTITPRVADKTLVLEFAAAGLTPGATYSIEGAASKGGKDVKPFKSLAFKAGEAKGTVKVEVPWPDVELWDLGQPNLYDLNAQLISRGKPVDAIWPERFGFREVAFDGRLVKINGNPVNMFTPMPSPVVANLGMARCMERNHLNYLSANHFHYYAQGGESVSLRADDHYDFCDEAGVGADLGVSHISLRKYLVNYYSAKGGNFMEDKVYWPAFERVVQRGIKRYGNRPSLFFYLGGGNGGQLEMGNMMNPVKKNGTWVKRFEDRPMMRQLLEVERRAQTVVRQADPHKPIIGQDGGNFNDAIHLTHYAGFWAIQEFIESDEYWMKYGTKPYMITEQSSPWATDWTTGSRLGHNSPSRYDTIAERAAATLGDAAFHRQPVDQEELTQFELRCETIRKKDPKSRITGQPPLGVLYAYERNPYLPSVYNSINYERCREEWLNWRAEGLGLLCDWSPLMAGKEQAAREAWAPLTGYLAGSSLSRTDKTHIFRPGESLDRRFLVLNNRRVPATAECQWSVAIDGHALVAGSAKVAVPAGGQQAVPIVVELPRGTTDCRGTLSATLLEGGKAIATDSVKIQVLAARPAPVTASAIALLDPEGGTAEALDRVGVRYANLSLNADLTPYQVVVFGRRAFAYEARILAKPIDLAALMAAGKRLLIMEQDEDTLRNRFKFRTEAVAPRSMFGRIAGHPVTAGLTDDLLTFWRGTATLSDGYEAARSQPLESEQTGARMFVTWNDGKEHPRQMKWGNHHNVATVVINKPERGNFRPLVDCEYNLDYAAVLEFAQGPGRMLFCQADVSGRTAADPAAERLLANLVGYMDRAKPATWRSGVAYLGGAHGTDILDRLQVTYRSIKSPADAKPGETLVLGDGLPAASLAAWKSTIAGFVAKGGACLSLPRAKDEWNWLPFDVTVKDSIVDATLVDKPTHPLLAGLSNGNLFYAGRVPLVVLDKIPDSGLRVDSGVLGAVPHGKGCYVFCQVEPDSFDVTTRFYLEESRRRCYSVYQVLLNNLGVPMAAPAFMAPVAAESAAAAEKRPALDLTLVGTWLGLKGGLDDKVAPASNDARWKPVKVPGYVNDQRPEWDDRKTYVFWYRCRFNVDHPPLTTQPSRLHFATIDDEDDVSFNGTRIGHTGRDTNVNDWLQAPRYYTIAPGLIKQGENEIIVRVVNLEGKCGIPTAPVRLLWGATEPPKSATSLMALASLPPVDLAGPWWKVLAGDAGETTQPAATDSRWRQKQVPGNVVELENRSAWCYRDMPIKEIPEGARPVLMLGAVDDEDDTFINGQPVGHTGKDNHPQGWWAAPRAYPIPAGILKPGVNRVLIKVHNLPPGSGSITGPVQICWIPPDEAVKLRLSVAPYLFEVDRLDDPYWWCGGW